MFHQLKDHPDNISARQHHSVARNVILQNEVLTLLTPTNFFECVRLVSRKDADEDQMTAACYDLGKLGNISVSNLCNRDPCGYYICSSTGHVIARIE